jgi:hypothetical protein
MTLLSLIGLMLPRFTTRLSSRAGTTRATCSQEAMISLGSEARTVFTSLIDSTWRRGKMLNTAISNGTCLKMSPPS